MQSTQVMALSSPASSRRVRMTATSARVACPCGSRRPPSLPVKVAGPALRTEPLLPPVTLQLGKVYTAPYALTGTQAVADSILPYVRENNAVLLANHGAVTWGKDLWQAFTRMETLERCAQILIQTRMLGTPQYLSEAQEAELHAYGVQLGHFLR